MYCSPNREAVRAATHYHTRAWQTLIYGKECYSRHCYIPSFQTQAVPNNFIQLYAEMSTVT